MIRPVVVGTAANRNRQPISPVIGQHQQISRRLRAAVRTGCMNGRRFRKEQIRPIQWQITIHFIRRYLMIPLDAVFAACIHQHSCPHNIRFQENTWIFNRTVYMRFSRKIDHHIRFFFFKQLIYSLSVADIRFDKTKIRFVHDRRQRRKIAGIRQLIQTNNPIFRMKL